MKKRGTLIKKDKSYCEKILSEMEVAQRYVLLTLLTLLTLSTLFKTVFIV